MRQKLFLGIDVGGTKIAAAVLGSKMSVVASKRQVFHSGSSKEATESVIKTITELLSAAALRVGDICAMGVGIPGTVDFKKGIVVFAPNLPFRNLPVREILNKEYHRPVFVDNDANVAALGEKYLGAGKKSSNFIYLTVGTGVGGAIVIDNKLCRGKTGAAGEIGHMIISSGGPSCGCGNRGCLEVYSSGTAIAKKATSLIKSSQREGSKAAWRKRGKISARIVAEAAKSGDPTAARILEEAGEALGQALVTLVNVFNPEKVIIGGGVAKAGSAFINPARKMVKRFALEPSCNQVKIVRAKLGNNSGLIGAAILAKTQGLAE